MPTPFEAAAARVAAGADHHTEARSLVEQMTLDEKLGCLDGDTPFWPGVIDMVGSGYREHVWPAAAVERLGIPGIAFSDGPRGCVVGSATAFPVSMGRGATFDPALEEQIGEAIGVELAAHGANYTGAVCLNLLRHPAWGRAQETYGEDPHHVGEMAAALTRGLQRRVLACMKHFALNSMENARFAVDVTADERALHEVYLPHFRRVADEGVASVMSAYNSVNGEWCGENFTLLTEILRDEWGWDGFVTSDFVFGLRDPVKSVTAGLNIEMPFRQQRAVALPAAVAGGSLAEADVDLRVEETVATLLRFWPTIGGSSPSGAPASVVASDAHRQLARTAAHRAMVLLRNEGDLLPVDPAALQTVAVLGRLASIANLGDGGSSDVHPPDVVTPLAGLRAGLPGIDVVHDASDASVAEGADLAVVVVGFTKDDEGEYLTSPAPEMLGLVPPADHPIVGHGADLPAFTRFPSPAPASERMAPGGDRRSLRLAAADEALIAAVAAVNANTAVVVMGGSAVVMPWVESVSAVLMIWYPGMEGGHALADVLTGRHEPGGRLPFAVPTDEAHLGDFDPDATEVTYGLFHGQWLLDRDRREAAFPFGSGLTYTTFELADAQVVRSTEEPATDELLADEPSAGWAGEVAVSVRNTGDRAGSTVVQLYGGLPSSRHERPERRLLGFARVALASGEQQRVGIAFTLEALRVRHDGAWHHEPGPYALDIGRQANDPDRLALTVDA